MSLPESSRSVMSRSPGCRPPPLERLRALAQSQLDDGSVGFEQLVTEYVSLRRSLASDFQELAEADLDAEETALETVKRQITHRMRERYGGRIPERYLQVRGYRGVHPILFEYLARHVGEPVPGARLRVLTGDQVHTERRLRELRDLGFNLTSARVADDDQYVLGSVMPDLDFAARFVADHNIRADRKLSAAQRKTVLDDLADLHRGV
jgi:hypothetical protein